MIRVFKRDSSSIAPRFRIGFNKEKELQKFIENNLKVFFNNLEFLKTEFPITERYRVDSVVYDNKEKCFAIIEYKKNTAKAFDQGGAYIKVLNDHKEKFVLLYNNKKDQHKENTDFNWDKSYVIFIASEFTPYQIEMAQSPNHPYQLYKIIQYQDGIIILEHIGNDSTEPPLPPEVDPEERYINENSGPETRELYFKIRDKILGKFKSLELNPQKSYIAFILKQNGKTVCTVDIRKKSKIKIIYTITKSDNVLLPTDFVKDVAGIGKLGLGDYLSEIKNDEDIEQAIQYIQKVYDYRIDKMKDQFKNNVIKSPLPQKERYNEERYINENSGPETRELYFKIRDKILGKFKSLELNPQKSYIAFILKQNGKTVCTVDIRKKSKIKIIYTITKSDNVLLPTDFVKDVAGIGKLGLGDYLSEIKNDEDIEQAIQYIQKVYDYRTHE